MLRILCICTLFVAFLSSFAQSKKQFTLLGGQQLTGIQLDESPVEIVVETTKHNRKPKIVILDKSSIFSVMENGHDSIWYNPDSSETGYSIEEMGFYVLGQREGRELQKTTWSWVVSIAVSGGLSAFLGNRKAALVILSPIPGALLGSVSSKNTPPKKRGTGGEPENQAAYIAGYKQGARMKKIFHSIAGSLIGTVVGGVIGLSAAPDS